MIRVFPFPAWTRRSGREEQGIQCDPMFVCRLDWKDLPQLPFPAMLASFDERALLPVPRFALPCSFVPTVYSCHSARAKSWSRTFLSARD